MEIEHFQEGNKLVDWKEEKILEIESTGYRLWFTRKEKHKTRVRLIVDKT